MGTTDQAEAERLAEAQWHRSNVLAEAGLSVSRKSFKDIAEDFIATIEHALERGEKAPLSRTPISSDHSPLFHQLLWKARHDGDQSR